MSMSKRTDDTVIARHRPDNGQGVRRTGAVSHPFLAVASLRGRIDLFQGLQELVEAARGRCGFKPADFGRPGNPEATGDGRYQRLAFGPHDVAVGMDAGIADLKVIAAMAFQRHAPSEALH